METTETTASPAPVMPADMHPDVAEAMEDAGFKVEHMAEGASDRSERPARPAPAAKKGAAKAPPDGGSVEDVAAEVDKALSGAGEDEDDKPAAAAKPDALDDDVKELAAIRRRSAERQRARAAAQARPAASAAPAAEPATAKAAAEPAAKLTTSAEKETAAAIRDVIAQIAKMTEDDEDAAAAAGPAAGQGDDKAKAARAGEIAGLRATAEDLKKKLDGDGALSAKLAKVEEMLANREGREIVTAKLDTFVENNSDEYPNLAGRRNAATMLYQLAERHYAKHGKAPAFSFIAAKAEAVLARRASPAAEPGQGEQETAAPKKAAETTKRTPRKTVSNAHASPPSARTGPDQRSKEQVENDLFRSLGIADDYE